jgi:hypothetical protein
MAGLRITQRLDKIAIYGWTIVSVQSQNNLFYTSTQEKSKLKIRQTGGCGFNHLPQVPVFRPQEFRVRFYDTLSFLL